MPVLPAVPAVPSVDDDDEVCDPSEVPEVATPVAAVEVPLGPVPRVEIDVLPVDEVPVSVLPEVLCCFSSPQPTTRQAITRTDVRGSVRAPMQSILPHAKADRPSVTAPAYGNVHALFSQVPPTTTSHWVATS
ncbi:MAG: hypothetical protein D6705_06165 [Deltaproteobacteria bacterium]|nr:MAG: hypothetical protein D6705_06165 [Deltaproteobacteria bacterium]